MSARESSRIDRAPPPFILRRLANPDLNDIVYATQIFEAVPYADGKLEVTLMPKW